MAAKQKNPGAIVSGSPAARLTPEQRSEQARKAALARWAKSGPRLSTSKRSLHLCLERLRNANGEGEIRRLTEELQRIVFHNHAGTPKTSQPPLSPIIEHLALRFRRGRVSIADFDKLHDWLAFDSDAPRESRAKAFRAAASRR